MMNNTQGPFLFWKTAKEVCTTYPKLAAGVGLTVVGVGFFMAYRQRNVIGASLNNVVQGVAKRGGRLTWNNNSVDYRPSPHSSYYGRDAKEGNVEVEGEVNIYSNSEMDTSFDNGESRRRRKEQLDYQTPARLSQNSMYFF